EPLSHPPPPRNPGQALLLSSRTPVPEAGLPHGALRAFPAAPVRRGWCVDDVASGAGPGGACDRLHRARSRRNLALAPLRLGIRALLLAAVSAGRSGLLASADGVRRRPSQGISRCARASFH